MLRFSTVLGLMSAFFSFIASAGVAQSEFRELPIIGTPDPKDLFFQPAATELMRDVVWLDNFLLIIITVISVFVMALLVWVILRYRKRANPVPATFSHNTPLEITWTLVPVLILVVIGLVSLPILFKQQRIPEADVIIKATGHQWYWSYEYSDHMFEFDSILLQKDELAEYGYSQDEWLLATDTAVVIPTGKNVVIQVTASDVIHSWTIPAFGVKQDGVPGRLAELWFEVTPGMEGIYFGQCSELCGKDHAYMPITVKAVTPAEYDTWVARQKQS